MEYIADRVVVVDCPWLVSQNYDEFSIIAPSPPEHPYLLRNLDTARNGSNTLATNDDASSPAGEESTKADGSSSGNKKKGTHRRGKKQVKEEAFNKRHMAIEHLLSSALEQLENWMQRRGASSIAQALGLERVSLESRQEACAASVHEVPDYAILGHMREATKPKFKWDSDDEEDEHDLYCFLLENTSPVERWATAFGKHRVLVPGRASFMMSDHNQIKKLIRSIPCPFRCIVIDPPWENRSVKRKGLSCTQGGYPMLPSFNLLSVPIPQLMHPDGCLVALWVTNREKLRRFIEESLLEAWGLRHFATWHWLKVATDAKPLTPLVSVPFVAISLDKMPQ